MSKKTLRQRLEELTRTNNSDQFVLGHVILCEIFLELLGPEPRSEMIGPQEQSE